MSSTKTTLPIKLVILSFTCFLSFSLSAQTAQEIVQKVLDNMQGVTSESVMSLTVERPTWSRTIKMKSWSKGNDYQMVLITEPVKEKGQAFLKREREMWNWIPSIRRLIKIPPSMMSSGWMGSDYTNEDLINESSIITGYSQKLLEDKTIDGYPCFSVELIPKEETAVAWSRIVMYVDKKMMTARLSEYFDDDNLLVRTMFAKEVKKIGDRYVPTFTELIPADKPGSKTIIKIETIAFDMPINDDFFSIQNVKRLR